MAAMEGAPFRRQSSRRASLSMPDGKPLAVAFLLGGSGPISLTGLPRDSVNVSPLPFDEWAAQLSRAGFGVVRYDKVTDAAIGLQIETIEEEYFEDILTLRQWALNLVPRNVPLVVVGHSLGGLASMCLRASPSAFHFDAFAAVNPPVRTIVELARWQFSRSADLRAMRLAQQLARVLDHGGDPFLGASAKYWRNISRISLRQVLDACPSGANALLVFGSSDKTQDWNDIVGLDVAAEVRIARGAGHFLEVTDQAASVSFDLDPLIDWAAELARAFAKRLPPSV